MAKKPADLDVRAYNSKAWDLEAEKGNPWTQPASPLVIADARRGKWNIVLTPTRPVPDSWLRPIEGKRILCLASGGGQQGPILAAAGAEVTVLDASIRQLDRDRLVARREQLELETVAGDMANLSMFRDETFNLIIHPVSNCFAREIHPVWRECFRVLKKGGALLSGFVNPLVYSYDQELYMKGVLQLKYPTPYSDLTTLSDDELKKWVDSGRPLEFGHSLEDQIGGQTEAGFLIAGFYEDVWGEVLSNPLQDRFFPQFMATRAIKPAV